jgi:ubiquinone/menaquinone biosynthesis C-methylase UbiE
MPHRVCPWWLGYLLASPVRRLQYEPAKILAPYVHEGMTVLEPGPGMGFFTLELARRVGASGRVVAVDIQSKMLARLKKRAAHAGLLARLDIRLAQPDSLGLADAAGTVDFVLAFAMVHEMPSAATFFREAAQAMQPGARLLVAEPEGHVKPALFEAELAAAAEAGLAVSDRPVIRRSLAAALVK